MEIFCTLPCVWPLGGLARHTQISKGHSRGARTEITEHTCGTHFAGPLIGRTQGARPRESRNTLTVHIQGTLTDLMGHVHGRQQRGEFDEFAFTEHNRGTDSRDTLTEHNRGARSRDTLTGHIHGPDEIDEHARGTLARCGRTYGARSPRARPAHRPRRSRKQCKQTRRVQVWAMR